MHVTFPLLVPGLIAQSTARAEESLSLAGRLGDPLLHLWAAWSRTLVAATARDVDEVDRCLGIMDGLARQLNQPTIPWAVTLEHAMRARLSGDVDLAEQLAMEALQIGTDGGEPDAESVFGVQLMGVSYERGNMGDLAPLIEEAANSLTGIPAFLGALALAHAEADRTTEVRASLEAFEAAGFQLPVDAGWLTGMNCYAAAVECRDPRFAAPIFEQLDPWSDQLSFGVASTEGPVAHYVAGLASVLGRHAEAESRYEESAAFSEQVGAKFFAGMTALSWGRMLVERAGPGDRERGEVLLQKALASASTNGYATVERRAAAALLDLT